MAKNFMSTLKGTGAKAIKAPSVKAKAGNGLPGSSSRARMNEAAGQKTTAAKGAVIAPPTAQHAPTIQGAPTPIARTAPNPAPAASASSAMVMPSKHPAAQTKAKKGSSTGFPDL